MDKRTFKLYVSTLLHEDVIGLSEESKIKYMKKWIRDYEAERNGLTQKIHTEEPIKIGVLVRTTLRKLVRTNSLSEEQIMLLQDEKYCKYTFDINYPFLKKVMSGTPRSQQRKINGYDRYWQEDLLINGGRLFVCNDWYERNRPKFLAWLTQFNL